MASDGRAEEQKKRTLDALERRFAQAEAEVLLQQQKGKKRPREDNKIAGSVNNPSVDAPVTPSSSISSKRGNISFSGYTNKEETEANHIVYCQLSHPVDENLLGDGGEISNRRSAVDHLLHELFRQGDSAKKYMQGSRSMKIETRIPLDNFVQKSGISSIARFQKAHSKRSKKHMSLNQHKKCGSFHLPQELHNFELFKTMHGMWKSYIMQLLKNVGKNQLAQCLLNADLHGAVILGCMKHHSYCCRFPQVIVGSFKEATCLNDTKRSLHLSCPSTSSFDLMVVSVFIYGNGKVTDPKN